MKNQSDEAVKIGIAGCGTRLRGVARRLTECAGGRVRVEALFDPSPEAATKARVAFGDEIAIEPSMEDLLARESIDWILVGSPNRFHREQVEKALAAGKNVFCEKPLATSVEDCLAMREAWQRSGRRFFFGFCLRYSPFYRKIRALLAEGAIGRLVSFEFNETLHFNHGGYIMGNWRRDRSVAGTHLLEKCCHDLDLANWFTESLPVRAASFGGLNFFRPENERRMAEIGSKAYQTWEDADKTNPFSAGISIVDNQVALLEYASGARAAFHTNCNAAIPERRFVLLGTEGAIRADALNGKIEHRWIGFDTPVTIHDRAEAGGHHGGDAMLAEELAACVLEDRPPEVGLEEGLRAAIACFGVDQAMDRGEVADLLPMWKKAGIAP